MASVSGGADASRGRAVRAGESSEPPRTFLGGAPLGPIGDRQRTVAGSVLERRGRIVGVGEQRGPGLGPGPGGGGLGRGGGRLAFGRGGGVERGGEGLPPVVDARQQG